jgi:hypothetical protein
LFLNWLGPGNLNLFKFRMGAESYPSLSEKKRREGPSFLPHMLSYREKTKDLVDKMSIKVLESA